MCNNLTVEGWEILLYFHSFKKISTTIPIDSFCLLKFMSLCLQCSKQSFLTETMNYLDSTHTRAIQLWAFPRHHASYAWIRLSNEMQGPRGATSKCQWMSHFRCGRHFSDHLSPKCPVLSMHRNLFQGLKINRCLGLRILRILSQILIQLFEGWAQNWYFKNIYLLILQREEGREREENICWLPPTYALTGHWTRNLGMCPDQGLNPQPFGGWDNTPTNRATLVCEPLRYH